ncbi:hypothetical protein NX059_012352 [Plenodomus lindquistii]|nr:hypothetical protein NX059_012352 [Plenodomus lindquistii]
MFGFFNTPARKGKAPAASAGDEDSPGNPPSVDGPTSLAMLQRDLDADRHCVECFKKLRPCRHTSTSSRVRSCDDCRSSNTRCEPIPAEVLQQCLRIVEYFENFKLGVRKYSEREIMAAHASAVARIYRLLHEAVPKTPTKSPVKRGQPGPAGDARGREPSESSDLFVTGAGPAGVEDDPDYEDPLVRGGRTAPPVVPSSSRGKSKAAATILEAANQPSFNDPFSAYKSPAKKSFNRGKARWEPMPEENNEEEEEEEEEEPIVTPARRGRPRKNSPAVRPSPPRRSAAESSSAGLRRSARRGREEDTAVYSDDADELGM